MRETSQIFVRLAVAIVVFPTSRERFEVVPDLSLEGSSPSLRFPLLALDRLDGLASLGALREHVVQLAAKLGVTLSVRLCEDLLLLIVPLLPDRSGCGVSPSNSRALYDGVLRPSLAREVTGEPAIRGETTRSALLQDVRRAAGLGHPPFAARWVSFVVT